MKIDDTEIEEYKFYQRNSPILINRIDINEIVLSSIKYIIGYKDDKKIRPLFIFFPKMNTYRILVKMIVCISWWRKKTFLINIMKFEKKVSNIIKKI